MASTINDGATFAPEGTAADGMLSASRVVAPVLYLAADAVNYETGEIYAEAGDELDAPTIELLESFGFTTIDVVSIAPDNPHREAMRAKFLDEHFHKEDEVRFFVAGSGLFSLHVDGKVYEVLCETGDLISVPDSTTHWFDMGPEPSFVAIRFFTEPDGWVGHFTGTDIAKQFPRYEVGQARPSC